MLPLRERDFIELWLGLGKEQREIAAIFEVTQAAVSFRVRRAIKRLKFFIHAGSLFTAEDIRRDLSREFTARRQVTPVDVFVAFWEGDRSRKGTRLRLGISAEAVRKNLKKLRARLRVLVQQDPAKYGRYQDGLLVKRGSFTAEDIVRDLGDDFHGPPTLPSWVEVLATYWGEGRWNQSDTAKALGVSQEYVNYRLIMLRRKLPALVRRDPEKFGRYAEGLRAVAGVKSIGRETTWARERRGPVQGQTPSPG